MQKEPLIIKALNKLDGLLKYPNLKEGEIGIQVGFDLSSGYLTTDLIKMNYRVGNQGYVIGVEPDPVSHNKIMPIIKDRGLNIKLVRKATYSEKTNSKLTLGKRSGNNKIDLVQADNSPSYSHEEIEVEIDTLDNIVKDLDLDWTKISHISLTNNGAEYNTLKGMSEIFEKCENLSLTIASGRPGKIGEIGEERDHIAIMNLLKQKGFNCRFFRLNESFWWGFIHLTLIKRKWIYGKKRFGVVIAAKGNKRIPFYQTFS